MGYDIKPYRQCNLCGRKSVKLDNFVETIDEKFICTGKESQICDRISNECWLCGQDKLDPFVICGVIVCPVCSRKMSDEN